MKILFFAHRVIGPWNSLHANDENFKSLNSFKVFLKHNDLTKFFARTLSVNTHTYTHTQNKSLQT